VIKKHEVKIYDSKIINQRILCAEYKNRPHRGRCLKGGVDVGFRNPIQ